MLETKTVETKAVAALLVGILAREDSKQRGA